jgi:hypothetical protein
MNPPREDLTLVLRCLSSELKRIEQRLQSETAPDAAAVQEFRQALDNARTTTWSVSELIKAPHTDQEPDDVVSFLAAERLRRFTQLVRNLCSDIERGVITVQTNGIQSLVDSVETLQRCLAQNMGKNRRQEDNIKVTAG